MELLSVVIPSRNEQFLQKTIIDLLEKSVEDIEIIAVLDGYWPPEDEIVDDKRVTYLHFGAARGMRNAINQGVALAKGKYIMKADGHCMFDKGFDRVLKADSKYNWVQIPRRLRLEPITWTLRNVEKPPMDYLFLTYPITQGEWGGPGFHGREWVQKNKDPYLKKIDIDDAMSFQGSCWFMERTYFDWLEIMDQENYQSFPQEAQEIGFKCWLSGGRVVRNKKTWYAHLHKGKEYGRGYHLDKKQLDLGTAYCNRWMNEKMWHKQKITVGSWVRDFFPDAPTWTPERMQECDNVVI